MVIGSLVSDAPLATTPQYCTVAEVAAVMQVPPPSAASGEGEPTLAQWEDAIKRIESHIDATCGRAWRIRQVLLEYHDFTSWIDEEAFFLIQLNHGAVRTLAAASGDAFEVWTGGQWQDALATLVEGRTRDYWLEEPAGFLRIRRTILPWSNDARVRVSYRYGESTVPADISEACALLTAARLAARDRTLLGGGAGGSVDHVSTKELIADWKRDAYIRLANYQKPGRAY